jgi:hypothetical protein
VLADSSFTVSPILAKKYSLQSSTALHYVGNYSTAAFFEIAVLSIDSAPSFALVQQSINVLEDSDVFNSEFAVNISVGEEDGSELAQNLTFRLIEQVSPTAEIVALFADQPAIGASNGTLSFSLKADAYSGTGVVFSVTLADDGTNDNGGKNISQAQTFRIVVLPVNDAPVFRILTPCPESYCASIVYNRLQLVLYEAQSSTQHQFIALDRVFSGPPNERHLQNLSLRVQLVSLHAKNMSAESSWYAGHCGFPRCDRFLGWCWYRYFFWLTGEGC